MSNIVFALTSVLLGWVALWPARRAFDGVLFHTLAVPLGLLAWLAPALAFAALRGPWSPALMLASAAAAALLMALAFRFAGRGTAGRGPRWWTYPLAAAMTGGVAAWQVFAGYSLVGFDAYGHWEASGIWLSEVGTIEPWLLSGRAALVPAWQAAERTLGGQWGGAIYPVMAVALLVLLARLLWVGPASWLPMPARVAVAVVVPGLLAASFPFRYHAFLVHTHMASALFLLGSLGCLALAPDADRDDADMRALLLASGLLASAFALTRPDTPAYLIIPIGVFAAQWLAGVVRGGAAWFWSGMLVPLWAFYGLAFATLGLWASESKLNGTVALLLLLALTCVPFALWALRRIRAVSGLIKHPADVMRLVAAAEAVVLLAVMYYVRQDFATAVGTMVQNLLYGGLQGFVWYFASGVFVAALLFPRIRRIVPFGDQLLFALFQFFVAAIVVHATSHVGRVALNDSFNRVSFHALPLVFWYAGLLAVTSLDVLLGRGALRAVRSEPAGDDSVGVGAGA